MDAVARSTGREPDRWRRAITGMEAFEHVVGTGDRLLTTPCAWCFDAATESVTATVADERFEIDLCDKHVAELLESSREVL
jgi:hypothetical protein